MRKSLRIRLTLWYVAVLATVLVAFSAAFYFVLGKSLGQRLDGSLRSATEVTALALNHETEEHKGQAAGEENVRLVLNTMHRTSFPRPDVAVWDGKRLVAEKPGSASLPAEVIGGSRLDAPATRFQTLLRNALHYRVVVSAVWVPSSRAQYQIVANESLEPLQGEMGAVREVLLITVPTCILLAAVGGYFLARKSLSPVLEMARTAAQITSHNLDQRLAVGNSHDELGVLAETFNRVFERLQQAFRQQRQFMADASHELRTPVSVALTATQVSLKNRSHGPEALYDTMEVVESQILRLRRVVEDMFMLAKADSGGYQPSITSFYLDEVVLESVRAARVLGNAREVEIRVAHFAPEAEYHGDEGLLRQLLLILLDNAVKHTSARGCVEVSLSAPGNRYRIGVVDTGCGIPSTDQPFIFDRFYRSDKSRSRQQPGAGSGAGLGLAIAQWITQMHRGTIWLEKSDEHGSLFCIELPIPERESIQVVNDSRESTIPLS
jgi:heavy metal sensor kinase